jgi:transcription elongation GreA/GreB family factor
VGVHQTVQPGSIVYTNNGNFFISIGAGKLNVDGTDFMAISFSSPIGQELFNKKENDAFEFRGKKFIIESLK